MTRITTILLASCLVLALASTTVSAERTVQWLTSEDVTSYAPNDESLGDYVYLTFEVPESVVLANLLGVTLEVYFAVDTRSMSVGVGEQTVEVESPMSTLQVFPLTSAWTGGLDEESLDQSGSIKIPVAPSQGKLVRIDITRLVRDFLREPSSNRGLVIGSLTQSRLGLFTLQDTFGEGKKARIVYVH